MNFEKYFKVAKVLLVVPIIVGFVTVVEQFLPLETVQDVVDYKSISSGKFGHETRSIYFMNYNDQFTQEVYNLVAEGMDVELKMTRFTKEVREIRVGGSGEFLMNDTSEVYVQWAFAAVFIGFGGLFIRKRYFTNKQYKYIAILLLVSIMSLIRLINLNF